MNLDKDAIIAALIATIINQQLGIQQLSEENERLKELASLTCPICGSDLEVSRIGIEDEGLPQNIEYACTNPNCGFYMGGKLQIDEFLKLFLYILSDAMEDAEGYD